MSSSPAHASLPSPSLAALNRVSRRLTLYHQQVILPVSEDHVHGNVNAGRAKLCDTCGYLIL